MFRRFAIAAAASVASLVAFVPAASAQTYSGVTLSFGSGGGYDRYDNDGYGRYGQHYRPRPRYNPYYYDRDDAWLARQRYEQRERWEQERARRDYWRHERQEHHRWRGDDDDD